MRQPRAPALGKPIKDFTSPGGAEFVQGTFIGPGARRSAGFQTCCIADLSSRQSRATIPCTSGRQETPGFGELRNRTWKNPGDELPWGPKPLLMDDTGPLVAHAPGNVFWPDVASDADGMLKTIPPIDHRIAVARFRCLSIPPG